MIKTTYKVVKDITSYTNKNNYKQSYWYSGRLWDKGYKKGLRYIKYSECYIEWMNKGIKYIL